MMSEVFKFLKKNILGIAVALGVCSFLYEAFIQLSSDFTLTKSAGILIFFFATASRYKSYSLIKKNSAKKEYAGKFNVFKDYLRHRLYFLPAFLVLFLLLHYSTTGGFSSFFLYGLFLFDVIQGYYRYEDRLVYLSDLNEKGLTDTEVNDAAFIKQWEENRGRGMLKYCMIDGGIIAGALLSLLVSFIWFVFLARNSKPPFADGPGEIFQFIGIAYLIGAFIGFISYRITWSVKQRRFERLTTHLH